MALVLLAASFWGIYKLGIQTGEKHPSIIQESVSHEIPASPVETTVVHDTLHVPKINDFAIDTLTRAIVMAAGMKNFWKNKYQQLLDSCVNALNIPKKWAAFDSTSPHLWDSVYVDLPMMNFKFVHGGRLASPTNQQNRPIASSRPLFILEGYVRTDVSVGAGFLVRTHDKFYVGPALYTNGRYGLTVGWTPF